MNENGLHAERIGDLTRMLTGSPAEAARVYSVTSCPRCTEIFLIAFAMFSTAMRIHPAASFSGDWLVPKPR